METFEAIKTRRSVRRFADKPVEPEKVEALFEAVRQSPSWANKQCWSFVAVRDAQVRQHISELSYVEFYFSAMGYKSNPARKGLAEAPVIIVAVADPMQSGKMWSQDYYLVDMGIAAQTMMLAARDMGLGTVFVGIFMEGNIKELLGIPEGQRVVGIFPLGYPLEEKKEGPSRKPVSEILHKERWGGK